MPETLYETGIRMRREAYESVEYLLKYRFDNGLFDTDRKSYVGVTPYFTQFDQSTWRCWETEWQENPWRRNDWDWRDFQREYINSPSRFEAALWNGDTLCGMAIGVLSRGREHLSVKLLEGSPDASHPLKGRVRHCLLPLAEAYANSHLCQRVRLLDPLDPVIPLYAEMGYSLVNVPGNAVICIKELLK
jgi:hypothetical protein